MKYATNPANVNTPSIDLPVSKIGQSHEVAHPEKRQKWPIWWSVIGVVVVCTLFWTAFFSIIF